jgi:hypothetical protein
MRPSFVLTSGFILLGFLALPVFAQESPNYRLREHTLNAGGHPLDGTILSSMNYQIRLDAIGDAVAGVTLTGASYRMDAGFVSAYRPPGEIHALWFEDRDTLAWFPEISAGDYNLYRNSLVNLAGMDYGVCREHDIPVSMTVDSDLPAPDDGYFYLVTVKNRLNEEGTTGVDSSGTARPNPDPCP